MGEASLQAPDGSAQPCVLVEQHRRDPGLWRVWHLSAGERCSSGNSRPGHSVYFTITTLSTVAFGDIVPVTSAARWFVISLVVIGLGVFFSAIASVISHALLTHNRGRKPGLADGIVVKPSHHPPQDGGFNASWCESRASPASRPSHARPPPPHPSPASVLTNAKAVACG